MRGRGPRSPDRKRFGWKSVLWSAALTAYSVYASRPVAFRAVAAALCTADLVTDYFWWSQANFDALSAQCAAVYAEKARCFTLGRCHDPTELHCDEAFFQCDNWAVRIAGQGDTVASQSLTVASVWERRASPLQQQLCRVLLHANSTSATVSFALSETSAVRQGALLLLVAKEGVKALALLSVFCFRRARNPAWVRLGWTSPLFIPLAAARPFRAFVRRAVVASRSVRGIALDSLLEDLPQFAAQLSVAVALGRVSTLGILSFVATALALAPNLARVLHGAYVSAREGAAVLREDAEEARHRVMRAAPVAPARGKQQLEQRVSALEEAVAGLGSKQGLSPQSAAQASPEAASPRVRGHDRGGAAVNSSGGVSEGAPQSSDARLSHAHLAHRVSAVEDSVQALVKETMGLRQTVAKLQGAGRRSTRTRA